LYKVYFKESDLGQPSPAKLFLFIDEDPDTINDESFALEMPNGSSTAWIDMPSKLHMNAVGLSFADGHAEMHSWVNPQAINTTTYSSDPQNNGASGIVPQINNNVDIYWLASRTSATADGSPYPFPNN
jgi:prepilin-type processing-associated H-X9-DG protein